jgi:predicted DNA-binding transcriptional regulator YafY
MRRADRLFQVVQYLRSRRLTTAEWLADRLGVSRRTIYRDMIDLIRSGVPIEGEAGFGYVLRRKLDLPPLMFDRAELAALELGLRFVHAYTEPPLTRAAGSAMAKIRSVLPGTVAADPPPTPVHVPRTEGKRQPLLQRLMTAADERHKLQLGYEDGDGARTARVVRPLALFFWGRSWTLLAWCELRDDFRSFRLDRIRSVEVLAERFADEEGRGLTDYLRWLETTHAVPLSDFDPEG